MLCITHSVCFNKTTSCVPFFARVAETLQGFVSFVYQAWARRIATNFNRNIQCDP